MIIAVEGLNASGKSYCINRFINQYPNNFKALHALPTPKLRNRFLNATSETEKFQTIKTALAYNIEYNIIPAILNNQTCIIDRYISWMAYQNFSHEQTIELMSYLIFAFPTAIIYIDTPPEISATQHTKRNRPPFYTTEQLTEIYNKYHNTLISLSKHTNIFIIPNNYSLNINTIYTMFETAILILPNQTEPNLAQQCGQIRFTINHETTTTGGSL